MNTSHEINTILISRQVGEVDTALKDAAFTLSTLCGHFPVVGNLPNLPDLAVGRQVLVQGSLDLANNETVPTFSSQARSFQVVG